MLFKNTFLLFILFFSVYFCDAVEMDDSPIDTRDMHLFPLSSFKKPLSESEIPFRFNFETDVDFLIHTMKIVQGSMPVYRVLSKKDSTTLMSDEDGDCKQIVFRYINYYISVMVTKILNSLDIT